MKNIIFFFLIISMSACQTISFHQNPTREDGLQTIVIPSAKAQIQYHGDYWFHDFYKKYFPTVAPLFLKYIQQQHRIKNAEMLFSAHTTMSPYFSSTAILYHQQLNATSFSKQIQAELKVKFRATNIKASDFSTSFGTFKQLSYNINHPLLKTQTQHLEYIGNINNETIRIFFWTSDNHQGSIFGESEKILNRLKTR